MMVRMDAPTPITPAGWYDDGHGQLRWWDGDQWTEHTAPLSRPSAPAQARPVQARSAQARPENLVKAPPSKLVWILPVVLLVAALIGGVLGAVAASSFGDSRPLKDTYSRYVAAERSGDCDALQQVTTARFRDDLVDDVAPSFTCAAWRARLTPREGEARWGMRIGPIGVLIAEERPMTTMPGAETLTSYTLIREDGRWKLDEDDSDVD